MVFEGEFTSTTVMTAIACIAAVGVIFFIVLVMFFSRFLSNYQDAFDDKGEFELTDKDLAMLDKEIEKEDSITQIKA